MAAKFNVKQMSVGDLVSHIRSYRTPGVRYSLADIRSLTIKDLKQQALAELWNFLVTHDPDRYYESGEPIPDRRRIFHH